VAHRGPDAEGVRHRRGRRAWSSTPQRSSTSAPTRTSRCADASGRYLIVFNGEIYNFAEVRRELESKGHRFATPSDTEVLLEAIKAWGPAALGRLVGMFALALWDRQSQDAVLPAIASGKKPLIYAALPDGGLVFASERARVTHASGRSRRDRPGRAGAHTSA
jgi:asparagine synthase (glutamine-hydrolysing)